MTRILFLLIATIFAYGADYQPIGSGTHMADPQGGRNLFLFRMLRKGNVHIEPFNSRIILFDDQYRRIGTTSFIVGEYQKDYALEEGIYYLEVHPIAGDGKFSIASPAISQTLMPREATEDRKEKPRKLIIRSFPVKRGE